MILAYLIKFQVFNCIEKAIIHMLKDIDKVNCFSYISESVEKILRKQQYKFSYYF